MGESHLVTIFASRRRRRCLIAQLVGCRTAFAHLPTLSALLYTLQVVKVPVYAVPLIMVVQDQYQFKAG